MSRTALVAAAAGDVRQIKVLDLSDLNANLDAIQVQAIARAVEDPSVMLLDAEGIAPLEREVAVLAFEELVAGMWPDVVKAYRRGADGGEQDIPTLDELLNQPTDKLAELIDGIGLQAQREQLHDSAWRAASVALYRARKVVAMIKAAA